MTSSLGQLWRTTTVRLTAIIVTIFVVFSVLLLGLISWQSSFQIQQQQTRDIEREVRALVALDEQRGFRATILAVERLSRMPGPGIYFLADPTGLKIVGNVDSLPADVIKVPGAYGFNYDRANVLDTRPAPPVADGPDGPGGPRANPDPPDAEGTAIVRSTLLPSGMLLVVGRDVVARRGFTAIIFQSFLLGAAGIVLLSIVAGVITALRVTRRIDTINNTATKIMSGNLSERIPVTRRKDEFDGLATNLNAMLDRIEKLMVGLKEVSDNVAHDLKTPLTRLRNKAEAALRESSDADSRTAALETTIAESDKLIRTFNALLQIARVEAGTPSGVFSDLDLSEVVTDVAELYAPVAEEEGSVLETRIPAGITMRANRELIGQAVVNLVENALKYGTGSGRPVRIVVGIEKGVGRVRIVVADNGAGIPEADRQRVMERFVRLDVSRTEAGSGLGLSLVAAVARLHRGELRIEDNAPGVRAVIDLPAGQG